MNVRALLIALATGITTVILLLLYLQKLEVETTGGGLVRVVIAAAPIEPGMALRPEMVGVRSVPQAFVEPRAVRETDLAKVIGLRVETPLKPQHGVLWTDLAVTTEDRRHLSGLVQPGMRAVSIRSLSDGRHAALIRPGDRVDVVANLPHPTNEKERVSVLVSQNLLVLAVGLDLGAEGATAAAPVDRSELVLTVSANVQQLQQLSLAAERGRLMVGLRNPEDTRLLESVGDMSGTALYDRIERPRGPAVAPAGPAIPQPLR